MSLQLYASNALMIVEELQDLLLDDEYDALLMSIPDNWQERIASFRYHNKNDVMKIVTATPANRLKLLSKFDLETRFWVISSSVQSAKDAFHILSFADTHLHPGGSYRKMIGVVHEMLDAPYQDMSYQWPFPIALKMEQSDEK